MDLKTYIQAVIKEAEPGEVSFDVGVSPEYGGLIVNNKSLNRVKFTLTIKPIPSLKGTK